MKYLFILIILMLLKSFTYAEILETSQKGRIGKKSNNCQGFGICIGSYAESLLNITFSNDQSLPCWFVVLDERELILKQPNAWPYLKGKKYVYIDELVQLPVQIVKALKLRTSYISTGTYQVHSTNGKIILQIPK